MKYTEKIINNWHDKGYTTIEQCKNKRKETKPEWYGKQISEVQATEEEMQELEKRIKSL